MLRFERGDPAQEQFIVAELARHHPLARPVSGLLHPPRPFQWRRLPMQTVRRVLVAPLMVLMMASSAYAGQQHIVTPNQLASTVADHERAAEAARNVNQQLIGGASTIVISTTTIIIILLLVIILIILVK